jgi:hypothetical protein
MGDCTLLSQHRRSVESPPRSAWLRVLPAPSARFRPRNGARMALARPRGTQLRDAPRPVEDRCAERRVERESLRLGPHLQLLPDRRRKSDRAQVDPISVPFLGRPLRTWTIPSAATRAAYGLRRTLAVPKSTSGMSRKEALDGSLCLRAFFISSPLVRGGSARADDSDRRVVELGVDHQQGPLPLRHPQ